MSTSLKKEIEKYYHSLLAKTASLTRGEKVELARAIKEILKKQTRENNNGHSIKKSN